MRGLLRSFGYAIDGIAYTFRTQRNFRIHLMITAVVIAAGVLFGISAIEWAVIAVTVGLVLGAEMTNTVAELAVDLLIQRQHPLAKAAKDVGAGAVFVTAIAAVCVGVAIFGPRLLALIR